MGLIRMIIGLFRMIPAHLSGIDGVILPRPHLFSGGLSVLNGLISGQYAPNIRAIEVDFRVIRPPKTKVLGWSFPN